MKMNWAQKALLFVLVVGGGAVVVQNWLIAREMDRAFYGGYSKSEREKLFPDPMPGTDAPLKSLDEREMHLRADERQAVRGIEVSGGGAVSIVQDGRKWDENIPAQIGSEAHPFPHDTKVFLAPSPSPTPCDHRMVKYTNMSTASNPGNPIYACVACGEQIIGPSYPAIKEPEPFPNPMFGATFGNDPSPDVQAIVDAVNRIAAALDREHQLNASQNVALGMIIQAGFQGAIDDGLTSAGKLVAVPRSLDAKTGAVKGGFRFEGSGGK